MQVGLRKAAKNFTVSSKQKKKWQLSDIKRKVINWKGWKTVALNCCPEVHLTKYHIYEKSNIQPYMLSSLRRSSNQTSRLFEIPKLYAILIDLTCEILSNTFKKCKQFWSPHYDQLVHRLKHFKGWVKTDLCFINLNWYLLKRPLWARKKTISYIISFFKNLQENGKVFS